MNTLHELLDQQAALDREIASLRAAGRARAIAEIRELMTAHALSAADIEAAAVAPSRRGSALAGVKVAPKYRDPVTGATWTGRGMKPRWLAAAIAAGKAQESFAV
jgi:DNA-binding protein H-NS